ncbi:MAG: hypothetical protein NTW79_03880 [Candidatus Berkelbacteria bacterium]|nr:hypothetical protein [Candidatus Berkelbacteria bacterium]
MKKVYKICVFVPEKFAEKVRNAMENAGVGKIGNYSHCTFSTTGIDRFMPLAGSKPAIGEINKISKTRTEKIEAICEIDNLENAFSAIKSVHPYEEVMIDVWEIMIG